MLKRFSKYVFQSVAGMIGVSVYVLADTFFISVYAGADGLAVLNLILPVYGLIYAIGFDDRHRLRDPIWHQQKQRVKEQIYYLHRQLPGAS